MTPISRPVVKMQQFGAILNVVDRVEAEGWLFEIVDLDGRRIDKVLASKIAEAAKA